MFALNEQILKHNLQGHVKTPLVTPVAVSYPVYLERLFQTMRHLARALDLAI